MPCQPKFCGNCFLKRSLAAIKNSSNMYSKISSLIWSQTFQCIPWYSLIPSHRLPIPYASQIQFNPLQTVCVCVWSVRQKEKQKECLRGRNRGRKRESAVRYRCYALRVWKDHYVKNFTFQIRTQLGILLQTHRAWKQRKLLTWHYSNLTLTDLGHVLDLSRLTFIKTQIPFWFVSMIETLLDLFQAWLELLSPTDLKPNNTSTWLKLAMTVLRLGLVSTDLGQNKSLPWSGIFSTDLRLDLNLSRLSGVLTRLTLGIDLFRLTRDFTRLWLDLDFSTDLRLDLRLG